MSCFIAISASEPPAPSAGFSLYKNARRSLGGPLAQFCLRGEDLLTKPQRLLRLSQLVQRPGQIGLDLQRVRVLFALSRAFFPFYPGFFQIIPARKQQGGEGPAPPPKLSSKQVLVILSGGEAMTVSGLRPPIDSDSRLYYSTCTDSGLKTSRQASPT